MTLDRASSTRPYDLHSRPKVLVSPTQADVAKYRVEHLARNSANNEESQDLQMVNEDLAGCDINRGSDSDYPMEEQLPAGDTWKDEDDSKSADGEERVVGDSEEDALSDNDCGYLGQVLGRLSFAT